MKKNAIQLISLLFLTFLAASVSVHAQTDVRYRAAVPFDFKVGDVSFKAGTYTLGVASPSSSNGLVMITNATKRTSKIVMSRPRATDVRTGGMILVFNNYAGEHYLADIITPTISARFSLSTAAREFAKKQAIERETVSLTK